MSYLISLFEAGVICLRCHVTKSRSGKLRCQALALEKIKEAFYDGDEYSSDDDEDEKYSSEEKDGAGGLVTFTCEELANKCFRCRKRKPLVHREVEKYHREALALEKKAIEGSNHKEEPISEKDKAFLKKTLGNIGKGKT